MSVAPARATNGNAHVATVAAGALHAHVPGQQVPANPHYHPVKVKGASDSADIAPRLKRIALVEHVPDRLNPDALRRHSFDMAHAPAGDNRQHIATLQLTFVANSRSLRYRYLMHEDKLITTAVLAKLQALPANQRNALLFVCVLNRSYDESATELGISREELEQSLLSGRLKIADLKDEPTSE
ncbi:sigma-70 family RNA polymerase sigma factor [Mongoliimonas terrestris]|uniref:sigma-70 family RNA polymerase sigma factor n=1 Tax=Mongoliimonas terrestris TaxID=1709001 RepID=UPI0011151801|nr:sigma-70 family RNA polymerase sigma factor [Mongoliimonas terrestris]